MSPAPVVMLAPRGAVPRLIAAVACGLAVLLAPACGSEEGDERQELFADSATVQYEGLSREQIRERAEPMSPARAESLGIIDTTIHLEDLEERLDTAPDDTLARNDTLP